uniref:Histone deacetylase interacting domain-containing protein n=1 Tax=Ditylenchus dipsaci TaxID=166011 RepID=A0A915EHM3_9BILA
MDTNGTSGPPLNHNQAVSSSSSAAPNGQPLPPTLRMNSYRGANGVAATYMHVNEAQPTNYVSAEYYSHSTAPVAGGSSGGAQQTIANHINHARPRVDDALSYLEQVRQQFADNPDVYNHFLEVMKEFKSHTIDTQGVIRRVSRLFSGNPNLITGFNTFLPPGYEVRVSGAGILIIEPNGINTTVDSVSGEPIRVTSQSTTGPPPQRQKLQLWSNLLQSSQSQAHAVYPRLEAIHRLLQQNMTQADVNAEAGGVTQQPIHFDQAVGYLNKIKERFSQRPEIYREFLNILGNYQRITNEPEADRSQMNEQSQEKFKCWPSCWGGTNAPHPKKPKLVTKVGYDMSVPECLEDIPLKDFVFFENGQNFFRCLLLYNKSLVSRVELVDMINPFLAEFPDLLKQFHEILGMSTMMRSPNKLDKVENRLTNELASQIDYTTCKRLGVSYRSLPDSYERTACSGRTKLCNAVLNDTWVSFPSWSSEDTSSVSSKKSQFEDFMYRTEDERFEVDILIEVNSAAITSLESIRRKIEAMSVEDARNFTLDTNYGCISPTLMARAVKKLYGEHATKVLEGLRENPVIAVAQVLKRLREKDAEWRSIREEFNLIWRDQIDKNYLKTIIQQLETIYDERQARMEKGGPIENGPHMVLEYPADKSVIHDANELLIHYVKRQQNIPKRKSLSSKNI